MHPENLCKSPISTSSLTPPPLSHRSIILRSSDKFKNFIPMKESTRENQENRWWQATYYKSEKSKEAKKKKNKKQKRKKI